MIKMATGHTPVILITQFPAEREKGLLVVGFSFYDQQSSVGIYSYRNGSSSWYCSSDGRQVSRWWNRWRRRTADNFGGCTAGCRLSANLPNRRNGHCECSHYSCWYWAAQRPQAKATCPERAPRDRQSGEGWTCKAATVCWFEAKVSDPNWPCESAANLWLQIGRRNISHTSWRTKNNTSFLSRGRTWSVLERVRLFAVVVLNGGTETVDRREIMAGCGRRLS